MLLHAAPLVLTAAKTNLPVEVKGVLMKLNRCLLLLALLIAVWPARSAAFCLEGAGRADMPRYLANGNSVQAFSGFRRGTVITRRFGAENGIKEVVPPQLRQRYKKWKDELLSTDFGRLQWDYYSSNPNFLLKVIFSRAHKYGAGTDDFEWNETGELIGATITLGTNLDKGFPDPVYYPIMNALENYGSIFEVGGSILASTKIIHEIAHVRNTADTNSKLFQQQNKLITSYNSIFLKNGYNTTDPRLVELAEELGGNPIEIWEAREYQSEVNALRYLIERISDEPFNCSVFTRMRRNVSNYARNYKDRFQQVYDEAPPSPCQSLD